MTKPILWLGPLEDIDADYDPLLGRSARDIVAQSPSLPSTPLADDRSVFDDPISEPDTAAQPVVPASPVSFDAPVFEPEPEIAPISTTADFADAGQAEPPQPVFATKPLDPVTLNPVTPEPQRLNLLRANRSSQGCLDDAPVQQSSVPKPKGALSMTFGQKLSLRLSQSLSLSQQQRLSPQQNQMLKRILYKTPRASLKRQLRRHLTLRPLTRHLLTTMTAHHKHQMKVSLKQSLA